MANETVLTIPDAINIAINELRAISVPADYLDAIGPHLSVALRYLREVSGKYKEISEIAKAQAEAKSQEGVLQEVPNEPSDMPIIDLGEFADDGELKAVQSEEPAEQ